MPIMNGWDWLGWLADQPGRSGAGGPVRDRLSARPDAAQSVADFGVQACLTKPFDMEELLETFGGDVEAPTAHRRANGSARSAAGNPQKGICMRSSRARTVDWALCASCWDVLETGFRRGHPNRSLERYLRRPGFCITDSEVYPYRRIGRT
jgi:hypothetical protein